MPDYLADRLADWMGWRPDEQKTKSGKSGGYGTDPAGRRRKPIDLLAADSNTGTGYGWNDRIAVSDLDEYNERANPVLAGMTAGRAPPQAVPPMLAARDDPRALLPANLPAPRAAPGVAAPRSPPGTPQAMPQAGGGGQPPPMMPSGAAPNFLGRAASSVGDLLGGAARGVGDWMRTPVRDTGLTRSDLVFDALGNIGRGLSTTGSLSTGIALASEGQRDLFRSARKERGDDEERQYRRLEMDLKRQALEQKVAPQTHVIGAGGALVGPGGEELYRARPADKAPTSIEAALFDENPEIRARAEELRDRAAAIKGTPTEHQRQELELSRKRLEVEIAKLNRPTGSASAPAPTNIEKLIKFRKSMAPDDPNIPAVEAAIRKESSFAPSSSGGGTTASGEPKPKPLSSEYVGKAEAVKSGQAAAKRLRDYYLPGGEFSATNAAKASIPLTGGALPGSEGVTAAGDIDSAIDAIVRVRTGAAATADEMALYRRMYMPNASDSAATAKAKIDKLEADLAGVAGGFREVQGLEREPAPAAVPAAEGTSPPAALDRLGKPATDEERATLPIARTQRDALSMPRGELFILPDGTLGMGRALRPSEGP